MPTSLISTAVTLMPHGSVRSSMICRKSSLSRSRSLSSAPRSALPSTERSVHRPMRDTLPRCRFARRAGVSARAQRTLAWDEDQASASARSAPASLLHPWKGSSGTGAIEFHATGRCGFRGSTQPNGCCFRAANERVVDPGLDDCPGRPASARPARCPLSDPPDGAGVRATPPRMLPARPLQASRC